MFKLLLLLACAAVVSAESTLNGKLPSDLTAKAPAKFTAQFDTPDGKINVEVFRDWAPIGADRFYNLVQSGFYNNCRVFRNVPGFVAQFGINGNPALQSKWRGAAADLEDDPVTHSNAAGTLVFATAGPNTRTTQVFINKHDNKFLDSQGFAPFGKIDEASMAVVNKFKEFPDGEGAPDQGEIQNQGNKYLEAEFSQLAYFKTAKVVNEDKHYVPTAQASQAAAVPEENFEEDFKDESEYGDDDSYNDIDKEDDDDDMKMSWE